MPRVAFVTLSRSDYASTQPVIWAALEDKAIDVCVVAGGSHMLKRYGNTLERMKKSGMRIDAAADFLEEKDDTPAELAMAFSRACAEFTRIFAKEKPDMVFIVGDRWEMLAVAAAASALRIPIAHHSGGDITQGSADNQTRYALSCLAHMHLTALPEHTQRLLAMGEEDWRVTTTGEPALTDLARFAKAGGDIRAHLGLPAGADFVLATFHPTSFDAAPPELQVESFLLALEAIELPIILTAPNPDTGSDVFLKRMQAFAEKHANVQLHHSMGSRYYAAMAQATFMIGNSSSGLWEAPSFKLPVINIGPRQQGRVHGDNVMNVALDVGAIARAVATVSAPGFRAGLSGENPYLRADTLALILAVLKQPYDRERLLAKRFIDPLGR